MSEVDRKTDSSADDAAGPAAAAAAPRRESGADLGAWRGVWGGLGCLASAEREERGERDGARAVGLQHRVLGGPGARGSRA